MKRTSLCAALLGAAIAAVPLLLQSAPSTQSSATAKKKAAGKPSAKRRRAVPKPPPVSPQARAEAAATVESRVRTAPETGIENAAAMVPLYELMYRQENHAENGQPLRVLQFGDSHTAADDWPGQLRARFQQRFGSGGPGFVQAGRPYAGFRRFDVKSAMSRGWQTLGGIRGGDGFDGIAGVSLAAARAGETLSLEAEGEVLEFFYWKQPGGGAFALEDNGSILGEISTEGPAGPGYFRAELPGGLHSLTLRTLSGAPVRVFGWVLERRSGITWETLGLNGAQADLLLKQDAALLKDHIARRNPALILIAYGTNESRRKDWTLESYQQALDGVLRLLREAAPVASILVVGAPDQFIRTRRSAVPPSGTDQILEAQRRAALEHRCAFWNLRSAMGGPGSMKQWVRAGLAQGDYVHLTAAGYRLVGDALYDLIMGQYGIFVSIRSKIMGENGNGSPLKTH
ncbi:MAG: SGNH/GDSL hydrolase family protein [Acidobacteriota bacterium]